jgi:hypothetical protein
LAEERPMTKNERDRMTGVANELNKFWEIEEIKARQRARERNITKGDKNTKYFHALANQRRRKTTIHSVEGPDGVADNTTDILKVATEYYKTLFSYESRPNVNIYAEFFSREEKLLAEDIEMLENGFMKRKLGKLYLSLILMEPLGLMGSLLCFIRNSGM